VTLAACAAGTSPTESSDAFDGHVNGLGADPSTGQTYAATHTGVWLLPTTELASSYPAVDSADVQAPVQIAERWQDTMGFTVVRPGLLLGSVHPDIVEQPGLDPPNLGLISSTVAAQPYVTRPYRFTRNRVRPRGFTTESRVVRARTAQAAAEARTSCSFIASNSLPIPPVAE
jgi:hypothetical protein